MNGELDTMRQAHAGKQVKRAAQGIVLGIDIGGHIHRLRRLRQGSENRDSLEVFFKC